MTGEYELDRDVNIIMFDASGLLRLVKSLVDTVGIEDILIASINYGYPFIDMLRIASRRTQCRYEDIVDLCTSYINEFYINDIIGSQDLLDHLNDILMDMYTWVFDFYNKYELGKEFINEYEFVCFQSGQIFFTNDPFYKYGHMPKGKSYILEKQSHVYWGN